MQTRLRLAATVAGGVGAAESLRYAIVTSRHSIKQASPVKNAELFLGEGLELPYQTSSVPASALTAHGEKWAVSMGEAFKNEYGSRVTANLCDAAFLVADPEARDQHTALGWAKAFGCEPGSQLPLVGIEVPEGTNDATHMLNSEGQFQNTFHYPDHACLQAPEADVGALLPKGETAETFFNRKLGAKLKDLSDALGCCKPEACGAALAEDGVCDLTRIPYAWTGATNASDPEGIAKYAYFETWNGGARIGLSIVNQLLQQALEPDAPSAERSPLKSLVDRFLDRAGGDRKKAALLATAGHLFEINAVLLDFYKSPPNMMRWMAQYPAYVFALLQSAKEGRNPAELWTDAGDYAPAFVPSDPQRNLVFVATHDVQTDFLKHLLGLEWPADGWSPDSSAVFGSAVLLELLEVEGKFLVRAKHLCGTPSEMYHLETPTPRLATMTKCDSCWRGDCTACEWDAFARLFAPLRASPCLPDALRKPLIRAGAGARTLAQSAFLV